MTSDKITAHSESCYNEARASMSESLIAELLTLEKKLGYELKFKYDEAIKLASRFKKIRLKRNYFIQVQKQKNEALEQLLTSKNLSKTSTKSFW